MSSFLFTVTFFSALASAWLPQDKQLTKRALPSGKIRGVNLGSHFIIEPWMASAEWHKMGCGSTKSENDCVKKLGQTQANKVWATHWDTWTTQEDISEMKSYGINTIRVPVGFWMKEDLVNSATEHFPQGGFAYLERLGGWASAAGLYIIMDLHGAPGAQEADHPFTGQMVSPSGFYNDEQYNRTYHFLKWISQEIHTNSNFSSVGMLEILNEPERTVSTDTTSMINTYYPTAWQAIRDTEKFLKVNTEDQLHIQIMDKSWGAYNPSAKLASVTNAAYDQHRYIEYKPDVAANQAGYLKAACTPATTSTATGTTIVGEWSMAVASNIQNTTEFQPISSNVAWYKKYFAAQAQSYEQVDGWIFWSWKTSGLYDWRWSYKGAVAAGVIPADLDEAVRSSPC